MRLVLISNPINTMSEYDTIATLLEAGVDQFHLRKPDGDEETILKYLNRIPKEFRPKVTLHGYRHLAIKYNLGGLHEPKGESFQNWEGLKSRSLHSLDELSSHADLDYAFVSPVFDSISKEGYKSNFDPQELKTGLSAKTTKTKTIALGGVDIHNAESAFDMGFDGIAVLGAIWEEIWLSKKLEKIKILKDITMKQPV